MVSKHYLHYDAHKGTAIIGLNQRVLNRIPTDHELWISFLGGEAPAKLADVNSEGGKLITDVNLNKGQFIDVRLTASDPPFIRARVLRADTSPHSYGVAWIAADMAHWPKGLIVKEKF